MAKPFFSLIVPAYNVEDYLSQSLDSVLSQRYNNYEIVLVDDCSTDKTSKICCEYAKKHSQIKLISNKNNCGLAQTRNIAIQNASGKWFVFLDSDDFFGDDQFLEKLASKCIDTDVVFYGFSWYLTSENKSIAQNEADIETINEFSSNKDKLQYLIDSGNMYHNIFRLCCNSNFWRENSLNFDSHFRLAEDFFMLFNILICKPRIKALNSNQYQYRKDNNQSLTADNHTGELMYMLDALDKIYNYKNSDANLDEFKRTVISFVANSYCAFLIDYSKTFSKDEQKTLKKRVYKHKYLLKFGTDKRTKFVYFASKFIGIKQAIKFLY